LAGGIKAPCQTTWFVEVRWKDWEAACEAAVLPGEDEILFGAYPQRQEAAGVHGDNARIVVK
jgi:hypothetical protein